MTRSTAASALVVVVAAATIAMSSVCIAWAQVGQPSLAGLPGFHGSLPSSDFHAAVDATENLLAEDKARLHDDLRQAEQETGVIGDAARRIDALRAEAARTADPKRKAEIEPEIEAQLKSIDVAHARLSPVAARLGESPATAAIHARLAAETAYTKAFVAELRLRGHLAATGPVSVAALRHSIRDEPGLAAAQRARLLAILDDLNQGPTDKALAAIRTEIDALPGLTTGQRADLTKASTDFEQGRMNENVLHSIFERIAIKVKVAVAAELGWLMVIIEAMIAAPICGGC